MVRVISEKLFSPPRSRHSSGETVDKELAARAVEVLSGLHSSRRLELSDYESSSDSHWDSEVDVEGEAGEGCSSTGRDLQAIGGGGDKQADVLRKRKERRRERNKLSAQAYRVRRKELTVKQQSVLQTLQDENSRLKSTVSDLEDELQKVRNSLKQRGYFPPLAYTAPSPSIPASPSPSASSTAPSPIPTHSHTIPPTPPPQHQADYGSGVTTADVKPGVAGFGAVCGQMLTAAAAAAAAPRPAMDNDQSHQQQVSPVVDNFFFSKPLHAVPPSAPSPIPTNQTPAAPHTHTHTGASSSPTPPPSFSFPTGARHHGFGSPFLANPLPTISEKPDAGPFLPHQHHHHHQQHHADFNANANNSSMFTTTTNAHAFTTTSTTTNSNTNANTFNGNNNNANVFGMYRNSNNNQHPVNNNNSHHHHHQMFQTVQGEEGVSSPRQGPFKMCQV